ncbi:MAG: BON domain-containing protein [Planctomycetaceae bacterium]|jgi:hypothetical protein|nr:BON domain-containing protein [Planctomycetaceae bacterium]
MKKIAFMLFALCCFVPALFGQTAPAGSEQIISAEDIQKSLSSEVGIDLTETVKDTVEARLRERMATREITEQTVKSAIEGTLVTEETAPLVDNNVVENVDVRTQRYQPRIALDFKTFPLRPLSGKVGLAEIGDDDVVVLQQTNTSLTEDIARRIQTRLLSPEIRFEFKNRSVILTGTVAAPRLKDLAEAMLVLEPGIDQVENRLAVSP